ncbi:MAG: ATP-binding protein [Oscillospiraceae bacterium]|nr:ATP-binding protein [Oscillospiraceae bacterium]
MNFLPEVFRINEEHEFIERFSKLSPKYQSNGILSSELMSCYIREVFKSGCVVFEWMYRPDKETIPTEAVLNRIDCGSEIFVSLYIRDLREQKQTHIEKERSEFLLKTLNQAASALLDTEVSGFENNLYSSMDLLLRAVNADRVSIWKNHLHDGELYATQLYEWAVDDALAQDGITEKVSYNESIPEWKQILSKGQYINSTVREISCSSHDFLSAMSAKSVFVAPIFLRDNFWGFVEFDDCRRERLFSENEVSILCSGCLLIGNAFLRNDMTKNLQDNIEELKAASNSKSSFLANMSHEIRTPMNAIIGITEIIIQNEILSPEVEEGLEKIYSSCNMLLGIINDILDLSKIEAGKIDIIPAQYSVASLLNDSVHLNVMRINEKPIKFELEINENINAKLVGDELRIKQVLNNLLSNAFKYTSAGRVTLSASLESQESGAVLVLCVEDTGCGLNKEQLGKLFSEYSRFNSNENRTVEGTGLGLAITQRLIKLMNGVIHVESEQGVGSKFTVKLPQGTVDTTVIGKEVVESLKQFRMNYITHKKRIQVERDPMPYGKILIVDDVETNLYVAEGLMKLYRLQTDTVMSGRAAINKIKNGGAYDIIFMDHMMPEMDGIEATKHLRDFGYEGIIIALTANAVAGQADVFLQNGFDDFISKPIDIRQLDSLLNKYVRDKQSQEVIDAARSQFSDKKQSSAENKSAKADLMLIESFIRDARKAVAVLDGLDFDKDLQKFIITVHGIKSSSGIVGEAQLSERAKKLEHAGREKNMDFVTAEAPGFLSELRALLDRLEKENKNDCAGGEDAKDLPEKLAEINEMCADYNRKGALDALAGITKYSKKTKEILDKIKEFVMHSEFEEAEAEAEAYANELEKN